MDNWNLDQIEQAFAKAAIDFNAWGDALDTVSAQSDSFGAMLFHVSGVPLPAAPMSARMGESAEAYFRNGWHLRDERYRGVSILAQQGVFDDHDIMSPEIIKRHPYYQEFLARFGLSGFAGVKVACGDNMWCLSIQRSHNSEPFSHEEKRRLAGLSRSMSAAAAVTQALGFAASDAALEAFEISGSAVLLIDWRGEVIRANPAAERLLGDGVRISRKRLVALDPDNTAALDRALHKLLWTPSGAALAPPIPLSRESRSPLLAYPLKLASLAANPFAQGRALIVLVDPDRRSRPPEEALREIFKLTIAEARLAARLAAGTGLDDVSDELGIAKETGRYHLKSIFAKTGARRQAELVALFAGMLAKTPAGPRLP